RADPGDAAQREVAPYVVDTVQAKDRAFVDELAEIAGGIVNADAIDQKVLVQGQALTGGGAEHQGGAALDGDGGLVVLTGVGDLAAKAVAGLDGDPALLNVDRGGEGQGVVGQDQVAESNLDERRGAGVHPQPGGERQAVVVGEITGGAGGVRVGGDTDGGRAA